MALNCTFDEKAYYEAEVAGMLYVHCCKSELFYCWDVVKFSLFNSCVYLKQSWIYNLYGWAF